MHNLPLSSMAGEIKSALRIAIEQSPLPKQVIAERSGISRRALYSILNANADPRLSTLEAVAHALRLSLVMVPQAANALQPFAPSTGKRSEHSMVRRLLEREHAGREQG